MKRLDYLIGGITIMLLLGGCGGGSSASNSTTTHTYATTSAKGDYAEWTINGKVIGLGMTYHYKTT